MVEVVRQDLDGLQKLGQVANTSRLRDGKDNQNAPWVEKYRPKTLDDVAAHTEIVDTIKRLTHENKLPHLLFYGPPGTGKTTTILAVARQMYGTSMANMVLELNASDDRGINVVRQEIQDFASTRTIFSNKFKLVILDECDAMTKDAQFALRRVMEKYTRNARFCLIGNYVSKIIPALQSRCTKFRFKLLDEQHVRPRLEYIIDQEGTKMGPGGMDSLVRLGCGDMRRSINILQSCHMAFPQVTEEAVYLCTGNPQPREIENVLHQLFNDSFNDAFKKILDLQTKQGVALVDIVRGLHPLLFSMLLPTRVKVELVERLAELGALVSAFIRAREDIVDAGQ
eukprot:gene32716-3601_t